MNISTMATISNPNSIYGKIASGKRIQTAADDAAGLAIANNMLKQENGLNVGANNVMDGIGVTNIKDGALDNMQNSLQRIHELSLKASNSLYGASEKQMIQGEIDQLLQDIESTAVGTRYNEMQLMDGSMADMHIASNPNGTGMKIQMENVTLKSLGIEGYNVTGNFDIKDIESAMDKIAGFRSTAGAETNGMEHAYKFNTSASLEMVSSRSRIEDLDIPKAVSEQKKKKLLEDYQMSMVRKKMQNDSLVVKMFANM